MKGTLYIIKNLVNGKVYIGKTYTTINQRFNEHLKACFKERAEKRPLYSAMLKYGVNNFEIEALGEYEEGILEEEEILYIKEYNSYIGFENCNGYNATLGGDGKRYISVSDEEIINKYYELQQIAAVGRFFDISSKTIQAIFKKHNITTNSNPGPRKQIYMMYNEEKTYFDSIKSAAEFLLEQGLPKTNDIKYVIKGISRVVNGESQTYLNRIFKRVE